MVEKEKSPSLKKLAKARKEGNVAYSKQLMSGIFLLVLCATLYFFSAALFAFFQKAFIEAFRGTFCLNIPGVLGGLVVIVVATAIGVPILARGWVFTWKKAQRSKESTLYRLLFSTISIAFVATLSVLFLWFNPLPFTLFSTPHKKVVSLLQWLLKFGFTCSLAMTSLGVLDLFYQRWHWQRRLRMTKQEWKDEQRESQTNK